MLLPTGQITVQTNRDWSSLGTSSMPIQQFDEIIKKHFQQEETILEKVKDCHADIKSLSEEIVKEHQQLTALFNSLTSASEPVDTMNKLGVALENHIRKEERVLFPLIQLHCPETLLQQIYIVLH